jgi:hypothetical protein
MLLLSLAFNLNPGSRCTPFFEGRFHFFLPTLVSNGLVLGKEPEFFNFLLLHIICWIIMVVIGASFKAVLVTKNHRLVVICEKFTERK